MRTSPSRQESGSNGRRKNTAPVRRVRLSPADRERMILDAAINFFAEKGFQADTRSLAEHIGVSQALIYKYFGSKEDLIERVYERTFLSRWNPNWESILSERARPLRERLTDFLKSYIAAIDDRNWVRITMHSSLEGSNLTRRYIQSQITHLLALIVAELRAEAKAPAEAEPSAMELELAWHLHSTAIYYLVRKHIHGTPVSLQTDKIVNMIVDNFLDGTRNTRFPTGAR